MKLAYTHTAAYKNFLKQYIKALEVVRELRKWDADETRMNRDTKELEGQLLEKYNAIKNEVKTKNTERMNAIAKAYKNTKNVYQDPQAELLKRQDFDLTLSLTDIHTVTEWLEDEEKDFSDYELLKIKAVYGKKDTVARLLKERQARSENDFEKDSEYTQLAEELGVIRSIDAYGLNFVYIPDPKKSSGYQYFDFSLKPNHLSASGVDSKIADIAPLIEEIKPLPDLAKTLGVIERAKAKPMEYDDFDPRVFRGSEVFEERHRFNWLKERFDDTTTNRFSPDREDYDIVHHILYLEGQLARKFKNNRAYFELYQQAMKEHTETEQVGDTAFTMARDLFN